MITFQGKSLLTLNSTLFMRCAYLMINREEKESNDIFKVEKNGSLR